MLRKIAAAVVLVPLALVLVAFAVANRQDVTVSLDPFSGDVPAASLTEPLFVILLLALIVGVVVGGIATWLRQARWRRAARRFEREAAILRSEVEAYRRAPGEAGGPVPAAAEPPARLKLSPPLR